MGGDNCPGIILPSIEYFLKYYSNSDVRFNVFGNKQLLGESKSELITIVDTQDKVISNDDKPSHAIKNGVGSSMYEAILNTANGESDAVISAGNTGAYMALSKMLIGILPGISRPALVNVLPTELGKMVMLDLGANISCSAEKLHQFAHMGKAVAEILLCNDNPKIGLLNIGTERYKGTDVLNEAYDLLLEDDNLNFIGFVEGTDIPKGNIDVIVTDGFAGNIALKTLEGTVKLVFSLLKQQVKNQSIVLKWLSCISLKQLINNLKCKLSSSANNGAPFIGLKKVVIKSHGNSDISGFAHAIYQGMSLVKGNFIEKISNAIKY